jgi:dihydroneopterin aldolase
MTTRPPLDGLVPDALAPRSRRIFLNDLALPVDIGFHEGEIGNPQRILISVEVWVEETWFPTQEDDAEAAWNYDHVRSEIHRIAAARRFNLQETLVRQVYDSIAARAGVTALRVSARKPDIYPDCAGVGVELASF